MSSSGKAKKTQRKPPLRERNVYVIEVMPQWHHLVAPNLPDGKTCFYVGETGRDIRERFREHLTGETKPGRKKKASVQPFKNMLARNGQVPLRRNQDMKLREQMTGDRGSVRRRKPGKLAEAAKNLERDFVLELRREGHAVYPKRVGKDQIPFSSYASP